MDSDIELSRVPSAHLINDVVETFSWSDVSVVVKDRVTKKPLSLLSKPAGLVHAGEMLAIMGPSGSGKTTLLNTLARRVAAAGATTSGDIKVNGMVIDTNTLRDISAYVEQEDALIGSLTVRETMIFAAQLALPRNVTRKEAFKRVDDLISSFGLASQAGTIVGTPIKKGLSGGQKKRLGVASRLVTNPRVLFLDEPTSGLDSALSYEVIKYIKDIGKQNNLVVIASIHQPSTTTYQLFDRLALLSQGRTCYFGSIHDAPAYFDKIGYPIPAMTNPAEFFLDLINIDLDKHGEVRERTDHITSTWVGSAEEHDLLAEQASIESKLDVSSMDLPKPSGVWIPITLLQRSWIKSYRDVVVYGIRVAMYLGLAIMMGTVWLRLGDSQENIQPFINAIFFGGAFMSFMAVAYVPAFLEDLMTFQKERANGLVGPFSFVFSNFLIGLPFLFLIAVIFSLVSYWLAGFRADGSAFMMWVLWLFLDLLAAESLVVLVSSIFPIFVVALAITAFANGLWMCVGGFLVPITVLNVFWKYVFHYIDYQAYVFQGMMVNEFSHSTYRCQQLPSGEFNCMYPSSLNSEGKIDGGAVLEALKIPRGREGQWIGIMIAIIFVYRVLAYLVLRFWRK
ncbi:ATP-binding cassette sub-family G member 5 [Plectosphaerella plurivora]|uniref:ATP-binding cassette sub-family G member 5 n=1 Tax=Plectosphaerella plurivora TaxID=936078 RepID=A0A9P9A837_9PEZI|nr:ATP-binding cassette sub-family G member 5 [Plectosphaerella plurivora]